MHVALCQCERCDSLKLAQHYLTPQSAVSHHESCLIIAYSSHTGYTMKGSMLSLLYHYTMMYHARWFSPCQFFMVFCRVHCQRANRFCTMKSFRSLLSADDASASDPVVLNGITTAACTGNLRGCAAVLAAWKIVWWKHPGHTYKDLPNPNPDFSILTHHVLPWLCPSMAFNDSL